MPFLLFKVASTIRLALFRGKAWMLRLQTSLQHILHNSPNHSKSEATNICIGILERSSRQFTTALHAASSGFSCARSRPRHRAAHHCKNRHKTVFQPTFAPIWLPHWPACKCTISRMVLQKGQVVRVDKRLLNSLHKATRLEWSCSFSLSWVPFAGRDYARLSRRDWAESVVQHDVIAMVTKDRRREGGSWARGDTG